MRARSNGLSRYDPALVVRIALLMTNLMVVLDCCFDGVRFAQFFAYDIHVYWSVNPKANSVRSDSNDRNYDVVSDQNSFARFTRENQHGIHSLMMHNVAAENRCCTPTTFQMPPHGNQRHQPQRDQATIKLP